jgi:CDP-glucose 4,6-dehydratase
LSGLGADLVGASRLPPSGTDLFSRAGLGDAVACRTLDLRHRARVEQLLVEVAPEIVFHLPPHARAATGLKQPLTCFDTNTIGTLNLLNAIRRVPEVRAVVVVTCAPAVAAGWCPRATSLACAELVVESYRTTYLVPADGIGIATLAACDLIGTSDAAGQAEPGAGLPGAGPPGAAAHRPFLHVLDAVEACLELAGALCREPERFAGTWQLGRLDHGARAPGLGRTLGRNPGRSASVGDAALPPNGRYPAEILGWRPALDEPTAIAWASEGQRRAAAADAGILAQQIDRFTQCTHPATVVVPAASGAHEPPAVTSKARDVPLSA